MTPLVEFKDIYKIYHVGDTEVRAADGVSFKIYKGEYVAIVGQSGSGKSTCMNIIGSLDTPTSGSYFLNGTDVSSMEDDELAVIRNKTLGFIFQQYNLLPKLSVIENVKVPLLCRTMREQERNEKALNALARVAKGRANRLSNSPFSTPRTVRRPSIRYST